MRPVARDARLPREFGARVRSARKAAGLSQDRLAELAGVHRTMVGHVERGEAMPTLGTIVRMAAALQVDPAELVRGMKP